MKHTTKKKGNQASPRKGKAKNSDLRSKQAHPAQSVLKPTRNLKEAINKLLELGKKAGFLTVQQINTGLPAEITSTEKIESVLIHTLDLAQAFALLYQFYDFFNSPDMRTLHCAQKDS